MVFQTFINHIKFHLQRLSPHPPFKAHIFCRINSFANVINAINLKKKRNCGVHNDLYGWCRRFRPVTRHLYIFAPLFSRFICVYRLKINWSSVIEAYTFRMCVKIHRLKSLLCSMMPNLYHNTYTSTQESASRAIEIDWNVYTTIIDSDSDWVKNLIFEYT